MGSYRNIALISVDKVPVNFSFMLRHQVVEPTFLTLKAYLIVKIILVSLYLLFSLKFPPSFQLLSCRQTGLLCVCKAPVIDLFKFPRVLSFTHLLLKCLSRCLHYHLLLALLHLIVNISSLQLARNTFSVLLFIQASSLLFFPFAELFPPPASPANSFKHPKATILSASQY